MNLRLTDGNLTQDQGKKSFNAPDPDEEWWSLNARVTQVHQPLLSVNQVVKGGWTVAFSPTGSYIEGPHGRRMSIANKDNTYHLKMWVPRDQELLFSWADPHKVIRTPPTAAPGNLQTLSFSLRSSGLWPPQLFDI